MKKEDSTRKEEIVVDFKIDGVEYLIFTTKDGTCTGIVFDTQVGFVNEFELKNIKYDFLINKSNNFIRKILLDNSRT